ncbi:nitroreductase family deazaflavin-dependent oxidoreductase [Cellulomonas sp. H30R-01]|nr:nitroreductase family deazaflavin-dependent oxidoreductase [Cellulomonas sp. H30R-01]
MPQDSPVTSLLRRLGRTRAFARVGRTVSGLDRRIQQATDGRWSVLGRPTLPQLVLTTTGRRSGEPRDAVLLYARDGERFVVIGSNWGQQHHPAWSLNLLADPRARVAVDGRTVDVVAHLASDAERERLLDALRAVWPGYDEYAARSGRDLRVFVLAPVAG